MFPWNWVAWSGLRSHTRYSLLAIKSGKGFTFSFLYFLIETFFMPLIRADLPILLWVVASVMWSTSDFVRNPGRQRNVHRDKRKFFYCAIADGNVFRTVHRTTKEPAYDLSSVDNSVRDLGGWPLIDDVEHLNRWKEHFSNCITSSEVAPLVEEMISHRNTRMQTVLPNRSKIILAINMLHLQAVKSRFRDLASELFIFAPSVSTISIYTEILRIPNPYQRVEKSDDRWDFEKGRKYWLRQLEKYLHAPCCHKNNC